MAKIVVADDEQDIRDLLAFTLRFAGHEVLAASDGEEAFQITRTEKPALVVLDVRMPRMNGLEACRQIKADPTLRHIPVLFISAWGQESEIQSGIDAGAVEYVVKPFEPTAIILKVAELLAHPA
jgi:CheY-like chemotaxis protein